MLRIPSDCDITIDLDIEPGSAEKLCSITCKQWMTLGDMYEKILGSGIIERYLVKKKVIDTCMLNDHFLDNY